MAKKRACSWNKIDPESDRVRTDTAYCRMILCFKRGITTQPTTLPKVKQNFFQHFLTYRHHIS